MSDWTEQDETRDSLGSPSPAKIFSKLLGPSWSPDEGLTPAKGTTGRRPQVGRTGWWWSAGGKKAYSRPRLKFGLPRQRTRITL